uniref:Superoxide dismutase n=1 Tax=Arcella intermedia TaxID=1963864 RepID=A0A6B2LFK5_9EUKA
MPRLPFPIEDGIEPVFSSRSLKFHYQDIQSHYCRKLNYLLEGTGHEMRRLEEIIVFYREYNVAPHIFNTASMIYNHSFMWICMSPYGEPPSAWMKNIINLNFGSMERFKLIWKMKCLQSFGCSWCWLVENDGRLDIVVSANAANPVGRARLNPLLAMDLWEHAYMIDYGTDVERYVENWLRCINWQFVEAMLQKIEPHPNIVPHPWENVPGEESINVLTDPSPENVVAEAYQKEERDNEPDDIYPD